MAFDRRVGRIVAVVGPEDPATWTFDVCTNTWLEMHPDVTPTLGWNPPVYDEDSERTVMVDAASGKTSVYDLEADTWTPNSSVLPGADHRLARFVYDPVSGLIVGLVLNGAGDARPLSLVSYDVESDAWERIRQSGSVTLLLNSSAVLLAHDASVDRFIAFDAVHGDLWLFDRSTGIWERSGAQRQTLNFPYGIANGGESAYDDAIERTIAFSDGRIIAYDAATAQWDVLDDASETSHIDGYLATGPTARMGHSVVYDPINERIVVYGGQYRTADPGRMWVQADDVLAFDPVTREWSTLLEASRVQAPPG